MKPTVATFFPDPNLRRGLSRLAEPYVLFPLIALVLLGVVWGTTLSLIRIERTAADRTAATSALELAETYEAQVVRALREIDQTLKVVKFAYESKGGRVDLADLKAKGLLPPDLLFVVSVTDAAGNVVASSRPPDMRNVADLEFFRRQIAGDTIAISKPLPTRVANEWRLHFSRRLDGPGAAFAGIVIVSVPATYFVSGYEPAKLGNAGVLALLGTDGNFRVRRTGEALSFGDGTSFGAAMSQGEPDAAVRVNPWDNVRRYTVARELFDFPLAVIMGLSEEEQMAGVNERTRSYMWRAAGGSLLVILFLAGLGVLSWQLMRTRILANKALREEIDIRHGAEAALNLRNRAIESSVNAIMILNALDNQYPVEYVNPAFEKITGYTGAEAIGRNAGFLLGADVDQQGMEEIRLAARERREARAVLRNYRKDGSLFWAEFYMAPVRGEGGEVTHFVGVINDVTEAKRYEEQLAHQANFDALTGLANRNLLNDRLQQAIAGARRSGGSVAAVFLDIDNFKLVNDGLGHNVGDELLQQVAARLKSCVRESDTVARLGGDEFVLVLPNQGEEKWVEADLTALVHKVLVQVAQPLVLGERAFRPTCSIGVSTFPQDGEDASSLLKHADAAMYRAKELGRNRFQFFTREVHERIRRRMELETSLRQALERDEFELYYQPQVGLATGTIVGVEALLRWRHPERGLLAPAHFIPFAEESGMIVAIGTWVLGRACAQNKAWQDQGLAAIPVAVNMSARQCEQQDLDEVVKRALGRADLEPRYLELEITESISMANPELSVPLMRRLKDTGVGLSIDDFGTGFSNLSYLKRFPVDRLKIDLSFVREITTDPGSLAISEAIITMSHSLNLQVVAEGVETQGQLDLLGARKCDLIQGYFFSPPVTAEAFAQMMREGRCLPSLAARTHDAPAMLM